MLHGKADNSDPDPTAQSHENRLATRFDQLYDVCIEADGSHRHNDEELGEFLKRLEKRNINARHDRNGRDNRREHKEQDKKWEYAFEAEPASFAAALLFQLCGAVKRQHERDRDDRQRPCQLYDGRRVKRVGAGVQPCLLYTSRCV